MPVDGDLFFVVLGYCYTTALSQKGRYRKQVNIPFSISSVFVYGGTLSACNAAFTHCTRVLPDIDRNDVVSVCDHGGGRAQLSKLISGVGRGDHVIIMSIFTLQDAGKENSVIRWLHRIRNTGATLHVVLEPDFTFEKYDEALKTWHLALKQRRDFIERCGPLSEDES